jgi:hypothetical protein
LTGLTGSPVSLGLSIIIRDVAEYRRLELVKPRADHYSARQSPAAEIGHRRKFAPSRWKFDALGLRPGKSA